MLHPSPVRMLASAALCLLTLAAACVPLRPARTPMPTVALAAPHPGDGRLFVLLPGLLDRAGTFEKEGFGDIIAAAFPGAGVVATDAHLGYYRHRTLLERLAADVLDAHGDADEIWLVGVSLGGMGALLAADEMPDRIDGLILLAPYVGEQDELGKVDAARAEGAAGVAALKPRLRALARIWDWLESPGRDGIRVILGYGVDDRLADSAARLARLLPPEDVITLPGGHDWKTWRPLLERALAQVPAATPTGAARPRRPPRP